MWTERKCLDLDWRNPGFDQKILGGSLAGGVRRMSSHLSSALLYCYVIQSNYHINHESGPLTSLRKFWSCVFQLHHGVREQEENAGPVAGKANRDLSAPLQREQQRRSHHLQLGGPQQWWYVSARVCVCVRTKFKTCSNEGFNGMSGTLVLTVALELTHFGIELTHLPKMERNSASVLVVMWWENLLCSRL